MTRIDLYFPDNKHGGVSVGYTDLTVTDHHAMLEYDESDPVAREEAEAAAMHWERNGVTVTTEEKLLFKVFPAGTYQEIVRDEEVSDDYSS